MNTSNILEIVIGLVILVSSLIFGFILKTVSPLLVILGIHSGIKLSAGAMGLDTIKNNKNWNVFLILIFLTCVLDFASILFLTKYFNYLPDISVEIDTKNEN